MTDKKRDDTETNDSVGSENGGVGNSGSQQQDNGGAGSQKAVEAPMDAWVQGGTSTTKSDNYFERMFQESERRRNIHDKEKSLSRIPTQEGGAKLFTHKLTDNPEVPKAYVLLKYLNRNKGYDGFECLADLIVGPGDDPNELMLVLVCLGCAKRGRHHDQIQIQLRQSNRMFHFVPGKGAPMVRFEDNMYYSAGVIVESERFTCPNCAWSARIENNCVIED